MTYEELKARFPNASEFVLRKSADPSPNPAPVVERHHENALARPAGDKEENTKRYVVRLTAFRQILLDEDNICAKFHVDGLRYAGLIPGDGPKIVKIETSQKQVFHESEEGTEIEIIPPNNMNPEMVSLANDYSQRLRRWLELKKTNPKTLEPEPSNSYIQNRWLADMTRKQLLKEFNMEKERKNEGI